jgi:hypothetical protein
MLNFFLKSLIKEKEASKNFTLLASLLRIFFKISFIQA